VEPETIVLMVAAATTRFSVEVEMTVSKADVVTILFPVDPEMIGLMADAATTGSPVEAVTTVLEADAGMM
jgi:hypothetical protein